MQQSAIIAELVQALRRLPGIGPKSATRMCYHLLERDRGGARRLAAALIDASERIGHCRECRNLTELAQCELCANPGRDDSILCVVESPTDILAIEQTGIYRGRYFVLMGHLSPLDGIGPEDIGLPQLVERALTLKPDELILALGATVEADATCHFIAQMLHGKDIELSRIAQGVPVGGELEHVDGGTLAHSINGRRGYQ